MTDQQEHLLDDLQVNIQRASTGKRFANYLIDLLVFYIIVFAVLFAGMPRILTAGETMTYRGGFSLFDRVYF
jgi:hypothetical protein